MEIDNNTINEFVNMVKHSNIQKGHAEQILKYLDLTSLNLDDSEETIISLCHQANSELGATAAICVYPKFVSLCYNLLKNSPVKIVSVANFPAGTSDINTVKKQIDNIIENGADEIDIVLPYQQYLSGEQNAAIDFIKECKAQCSMKTLKVIIETGALKDPIVIAAACYDVIIAGADFVKTSTGRLKINATLEAATVMLLTIKRAQQELGRTIGFKASGSIRSMDQAVTYLQLANIIMSEEWVNVDTFRIGSSSLLFNIYKNLENSFQSSSNSY